MHSNSNINSYQNNVPEEVHKNSNRDDNLIMEVTKIDETITTASATSSSSVSIEEENDLLLLSSPPTLAKSDNMLTSNTFQSKLLFTTLGIGSLYSYNAIISCIDWFEYILTVSSNTAKDSASSIESKIAFSSISTLVVTTLVLLKLSLSDTNSFYLMNKKNQTQIGFLLNVALLLLYCTAKTQYQIIALSSMVGFGNAISQSGVYATAASIHPTSTAYVSLGSAFSGLVASGLRFIVKFLFTTDEKEERSSFVFFILDAFFLFCCFLASRRVFHDFHVQTDDEEEEKEEAQQRQEEQYLVLPSNRQVLEQVWRVLVAMFVNFLITLSVFPGVISTLPSSGLIPSKWLPITLITIFNLFDCLGRAVLSSEFLSQIIEMKSNFYSLVFWPSFTRVIFLPLFLFYANHVFLQQDLFLCFLVASLGFSNGFIASACFIVGPTLVEQIQKKEHVSLWLLLALYFGLLTGSFFGIILS